MSYGDPPWHTSYPDTGLGNFGPSLNQPTIPSRITIGFDQWQRPQFEALIAAMNRLAAALEGAQKQAIPSGTCGARRKSRPKPD